MFWGNYLRLGTFSKSLFSKYQNINNKKTRFLLSVLWYGNQDGI